jgi:hypothetical protein
MLQFRNSLVVCAIVLGTALGLQANTVPAAHVGPCPTTGTYATLEHDRSCTIGDKTFSGFTFTSHATGIGAHPITPSGLHYSTINDGTEAIGFSFSGPIHAGFAQTSTVVLDYEVSGSDIIDAQSAITAHISGLHGFGAIGQNVCLGSSPASRCPNPSANLRTLFVGEPSGPSTDTITFSPVHEVSFNKGITAFGGLGSTDITHFSETVSQVPEPGTMLLFGTGLLLLVLIVSRKQLRGREIPA